MVNITEAVSRCLIAAAAFQKVTGHPEAWDNWQAAQEQRARANQQRCAAVDRFARAADGHLRDSWSLGSEFGSSRESSFRLDPF